MSVVRRTPNKPITGLFCAALLASSCGFADLRGLDFSLFDDPAFRAWAVAARVPLESPSRSPLYTEDSVVAGRALAGVWVEAGHQFPRALLDSDKVNSRTTWAFEASDETGYRLTIANGEFSSTLDAVILRLGRHRFLDVRIGSATYRFSDQPLRPLRGFFKLVFRDDRMQLTALSQEWLETMLESDDLTIEHEVSRSGLITLTAETDELRAFVLRFADDPEAFPTPEAGGPGFQLFRPDQK